MNQFAARQYGVFSTAQARSAGYDKSAVRRRVESGEWLKLDHNVYAVASSAPKWERLLAAAVLSRPRAILTGETAAHLHELRGFPRRRPTILLPQGSNTRSNLARVVETGVFHEVATVRVSGFVVTTVPETLLILAGRLSRQRLESVFDDALLGGKMDLQEFDAILGREHGRRTRGLPALAEMVAHRSPTAPTRSGSYLEALLEGVLRGLPIPNYTREYPFAIQNRAARVDFFIPTWRVVAEADGRNWHMRHNDYDDDRRRDNALAAEGIQVLRFSYRMLTKEPGQCGIDLLTAGRVRAAQGFE
ncbi:MAG: type IV toxin-antitoxin system AbiEi family antitoxin domain-containing protein [Acidimicrobiia bacterium]